MIRFIAFASLMLGTSFASAWDEPPDLKMVAGLRPYAEAVGKWKGDGTGETMRGWSEKLDVTWGFRKSDGRASLSFFPGQGKLFKEAILTYDPKEAIYRFSARKTDGSVMRFEGKSADKVTIRLDRLDESTTDKLDRLEFKVLRGGDKMMLSFRKKRGKSSYDQFAVLEYFREGGDEASARKFETGPFCVVTGGPGRVQFEHKGKTIHVACESCKEEYLANPDRYARNVKD